MRALIGAAMLAAVRAQPDVSAGTPGRDCDDCDIVRPHAGRNAYAKFIEGGAADLILTYCTNAVLAKAEVANAQILTLPDALAVGADYGLTIVNGARPDAVRLAMYILSPAGQAILARHGFSAPGLPGS